MLLPDAEDRIHPENQGAVTDVRAQCLRLILKPLLISKEKENDHHRCPEEMVIKVVFEDAKPDQCIY
jgi:hypothetical protein